MFRIIVGALDLIPVIALLIVTFGLCITVPLIGFPLAFILFVIGVKGVKKGWNDGKKKLE
ncbi:MAG: hypothetical protein EAZ92_01535 [Candidatus Kapaibacterium sp.]|nr:MAG: hypothetical protein EAZ92_01535 [Candidatus Kapabacteria bacterium]